MPFTSSTPNHKLHVRGFTLIELLIVIVILGLLMSLVAPQMFSKVGSSKRKVALAQMEMMGTALDTYRLDVGDYPKELNSLVVSDSELWDGPYLGKEVPLDPWGNAYVYKVPGDEGRPYSLLSYGKDGQKGGADEAEDLLYK